jgi:hypothetical protein
MNTLEGGGVVLVLVLLGIPPKVWATVSELGVLVLLVMLVQLVLVLVLVF